MFCHSFAGPSSDVLEQLAADYNANRSDVQVELGLAACWTSTLACMKAANSADSGLYHS